MPHSFKPGDPVIYRRKKHSTHPGPRAQNVHPEARGESYSYQVDKFWMVAAVRPDGMLLLRTRTGKEHLVPVDDPNLRRPNIWERLFNRRRFPRLEQTAT